jgi:hypothetical protein
MPNLQKDEYENKLRVRGCELLGSGLYSNVFSVPGKPDRAIKVAYMDVWPEYIKWATENGHAGGFAPKVYSLKFYDDYYVAVMERLVCTIGNIRYDFKPAQVRIFETLHNADKCEAVDLVEYVRTLAQNRLSDDLHNGNVMLRSDGSMVVTDPSSGTFRSDRFRIKHSSLSLR